MFQCSSNVTTAILNFKTAVYPTRRCSASEKNWFNPKQLTKVKCYTAAVLPSLGLMRGLMRIRDGPLENLSGRGADEVQKKYSCKAKLNEKKFMHAN